MVENRTAKATFPFLTRWQIWLESSLILLGFYAIIPPLFDRLSQAVVVVPLDLLDFKRCGNFLHPSGTRPLHCGCGGCILYYYTPLLVVPHYGQPAGEWDRWYDIVTVHTRVDIKKCCLCYLSQSLKGTSQSNPFSKVWWYRLFQYFEENVRGTIPRNYQLPVLRSQQWSRGVKYSKLDAQWTPPLPPFPPCWRTGNVTSMSADLEDDTNRCSTMFSFHL